MFILLILFSCVGTYLFLYKHIIDAIEFTCINYDDLLENSTQIYVPEVKTKTVEKYEDKYKSEMVLIPNQIVVVDVDKRFDILLKQSITEITDRINRELLAYESELNIETEYKEQRTHFINDKMEKMKMELWERILVKDDILELAVSQLIQERLEKLNYSFVMEHTPIGNVVMYYNSAKEAFEYYSDNVVPYRYLDTVCRKYVIMNLCTPLYVDINEELKEFQNRVIEEKLTPVKKQTPNVFVKLKNYKTTPSKPVAKVMLKARTNKYLYQGRMNNFNFMKRVEIKSEFSYAEYKQRLLNK
jgi:hypothetical protein